MTRYYCKSLFRGWIEVSAEQQQSFIKHLQKNVTALAGKDKENYIASRIKTEEE